MAWRRFCYRRWSWGKQVRVGFVEVERIWQASCSVKVAWGVYAAQAGQLAHRESGAGFAILARKSMQVRFTGTIINDLKV